ncbi:MAG: hypothetical protein K2O59_13985, partial [Lachnospiraceae bacterium]|nr:hypothetical protein [Lachnospiraceae bacterium]
APFIFAIMINRTFFQKVLEICLTFANMVTIITGTIQVYGSGLHFSFKPSAFESEIHPLYKLRLCNGDFALAGGRKSR